jgi:hypothetical protein
MESNVCFYSRRAVQEAQAARRAVTEAARERHRALAEKFSLLATGLQSA